MGVRALTFAASQRMLPSKVVDPTIGAILTQAAKDRDSAVQMAVSTAQIVLNDELGAEARPGDLAGEDMRGH